MAGIVQNQDSYMQSVAAQRPFFFDHIQAISEQCFEEFYKLTGRRYQRVMTYRAEDADYLILGQGSMIPTAEAVVDYIRESRGIKVGVVNMIMFRPFPGDLVSKLLKGKKGVAVLERLDQPLAVDLPLIREIRAAISKSLENGQSKDKNLPYPEYEAYKSAADAPVLYSGSFGGVVFRFLWYGKPRSAAGGAARRHREYAAGGQTEKNVLPVYRFHPGNGDDAEAGNLSANY
jgi:pyruvate-ferredoxin/flavodoxin oxidoreductase